MVGAFWDPAEVRAANKERRKVKSFMRKHRNVIAALLELSKAEDDLEAVGVDPDELYSSLDLDYLGVLHAAPNED